MRAGPPLFGNIDMLPTTASDTFKGDHDEYAVVFGCLEGFAESRWRKKIVTLCDTNDFTSVWSPFSKFRIM